jgi:hypothetical protein
MVCAIDIFLKAYKNQGCGFGSELDPDLIGSVDPDPDSEFPHPDSEYLDGSGSTDPIESGSNSDPDPEK